jgi:hypothetical protein
MESFGSGVGGAVGFHPWQAGVSSPVDIFQAVYFVVAVIAGSIASVAGFGIGSLLTPTLGFEYGIKLAVAAVSIPHFIGTALRFWLIRRSVDRRVLFSFGLMSAAGGLAGGLLHTVFSSPILAYVLAALLIFVGLSELSGSARRMRIGGIAAWVAGGVSGLLGGLVGNQGGIRSAALLSFDLSKEAFIATATAVALVVDAARMPVYFATQARQIADIWVSVLVTTVGVVLGTIAGRKTLYKIPEPTFRTVVSVVILILGVVLLIST